MEIKKQSEGNNNQKINTTYLHPLLTKPTFSRLPIYITTAEPLAAHVNTDEGLQLAQRTKTYIIQTTIEHAGEALVPAIKLAKPPHHITAAEFAILNIEYSDDIDQYTSSIDKEYTLNTNRINNNLSNYEYKLILKDLY